MKRGGFITLPCDVGDKVYSIGDLLINNNIESTEFYYPIKVYIIKTIIKETNNIFFIAQEDSNKLKIKIFDINDFGSYVFMNKEEFSKKNKRKNIRKTYRGFKLI